MRLDKDIQNTHALNLKFEEIHISNVESGRKGYLCRGCQRELQAVKSLREHRKHYFRHDSNASKGFSKCTYSDETYRHKLAKEVLLRIKLVKVPAVYKYPPKNIDGLANLIRKERLIEAADVKQEMYFFENENGEIKWAKALSAESNRFLLLKPDIAFFNFDGQPILLIEIVATHKVSEKKQLALKRLGIDTIEIIIPKDSVENIEKSFKTTTYTKWVYNYEQDNAKYVHIPNSSTEGVPPIDEYQRRLFEESFRCRKSQISNLIRTLRGCLESEQYRTIAGDVESELSRVKRNSENARTIFENLQAEHEQRAEGLRTGVRARIIAKYAERRRGLDTEKEDFIKEKGGFLNYCREWNTSNDTEFTRDREGIENQLNEQFRIGRVGIEDIKGDLEKRYLEKNSKLEADIQSTEGIILELREKISGIDTKYEQERNAAENTEREINRLAGKIRDFGEVEKSETELCDREFKRKEEIELEFRTLEEEIRHGYSEKGREIESRFQELRKEFTTAVKTRTHSGNGFTRAYKNALEDLDNNISAYVAAEKLNRRIKQASKCISKSSYKNWHD